MSCNDNKVNEACAGLSGWTESTETTNTTVPPIEKELNNHVNTKRRAQEREQLEREQELKGIECVICMSEIRDVIIMPCRHLCLCKMCAINLRVQSNNCPICRIPFIALLQIKLLRKKDPTTLEKHQALVSSEVESFLPTLKIQGLSETNCHENDVVALGDEDNLNVIRDGPIVQIDRQNTELNNGNVLVECSNDPRQIQLTNNCKSLLDSYECVTIYEVKYCCY